jgi:hypothetical protein
MLRIVFLEKMLRKDDRTNNCTVRDGFSSQADACVRPKMEFCYNRSSQQMGASK